MKLSPILRSAEGGHLLFRCPGCDELHMIRVAEGTGPGWGYNGNPDAPTFTPSVLVTSGHYTPGGRPDKGCWCTYNAAKIEKGEEPSDFKCGVCHSFVTDGRIQFLGDCTHALAGQTVDLPPVDEEGGQ